MSNYTQTTFFAPKDALLTGNPLKLIKGADVDPEFAAIATAITTKYDATNISSAPVGFADGTVAAPGITFAAQTNVGFFRIGTSDLGISVNGLQVVDFKTGVIVGAPTGGDQGAGTVNATGLFVNGVAVATAVGANPTATVGTTAVNGTATTFLRSDGAPAINLTMSPTWSGTHTFSGTGITTTFAGKVVIGAPSSGTALTVNGFAGQVPLAITADNTGNWSATFTSTSATESRTAIAFINNRTTSQTWAIGQNPDGGTDKSFAIRDVTRNVVTLNITNTGNINIAAPSSGVALTITGLANSDTVLISGSGTSGQSKGLHVVAGSTSADYAAIVGNQAQTLNFLQINGDGSGFLGPSATKGLSWNTAGNVTVAAPSSGVALTVTGVSGSTAATFNDGAAGVPMTFNSTNAAGGYIAFQRGAVNKAYIGDASQLSGGTLDDFTVRSEGGKVNLAISSVTKFSVVGSTALQGWGPVAAALVDMTPDTSTFTFTITGCTTAPTGTGKWVRVGNLVTLFVPSIFATSNTTALTFTGMPAAIQPATTQSMALPASVAEDSGAPSDLISCKVTASSGTLTFLISNSATSFTNVGGKGVLSPFTISYLLN